MIVDNSRFQGPRNFAGEKAGNELSNYAIEH